MDEYHDCPECGHEKKYPTRTPVSCEKCRDKAYIKELREMLDKARTERDEYKSAWKQVYDQVLDFEGDWDAWDVRELMDSLIKPPREKEPNDKAGG